MGRLWKPKESVPVFEIVPIDEEFDGAFGTEFEFVDMRKLPQLSAERIFV